MGLTTITAARIRKGQLNGQSGEEGRLHFETFPYTGILKVTFSAFFAIVLNNRRLISALLEWYASVGIFR